MKLITAKELATLLGVRIETVYRMNQEGRIPTASRVGPKLRFDQAAIDEWLKQGGTAQ